jgi:hypothetical protein
MAEKKNTPNPDGRKGSTEHQNKIDQIANQKNKLGYTFVKEYFIRLVNGDKRFADLAVFDEGKLIELHQVGVQNKNGEAVSREKRVMLELFHSTGITPFFHAYKTRIITIFILLGFSFSWYLIR